MPRSLSGLKTGDFDTLEVSDKITAQDLETQGQFTHTGPTLQFTTLKVGAEGVLDPVSPDVLRIAGGVNCGAITTTGLGAGLTVTLPDGTSSVYNGGAAVAVTIPSSQTLTVLQGGSTLGAYDTTTDQTITIPAPAALRTLTLQQGAATLGTFDPGGGSNQSIAIPTPNTVLTSTLTSATARTVNVNDAPSLVHSGFGFSLGTLPANTKVKVDVQMCVSNPTSSTEEFFVALTTSKTSLVTNYVRKFVKKLKPSDLKIVRFSAVLTLTGASSIGLAVDTKDVEYGVVVQYGGDFPDVIMTAEIVTDTTTTVADSDEEDGGDY